MSSGLRLMSCAAVLLLGATTATAVPVFTEDFSGATPGTNHASPVGAFAITGGNVDVLGSLNGSLLPTFCTWGGMTGNCLDLNGSGSGTVSSGNLTLNAGNYVLSFILNGIAPQVAGGPFTTSAMVTLGSLFSQSYTLTQGQVNAVSAPITVASTTTAPLIFQSTTGGAAGPMLDNVVLDTAVATAIPEPATTSLIMSGLAVVVLSRARKFRPR